MVRTVIAPKDYYVTVDAFDANGDVEFTCRAEDLTFMQAGDYAETAVNYFKFAMHDHRDWVSVIIEINAPHGVVEIVELIK